MSAQQFLYSGPSAPAPSLATLSAFEHVASQRDAELNAERLWWMEAHERHVAETESKFEEALRKITGAVDASIEGVQERVSLLLEAERGHRSTAIAGLQRQLDEHHGRLTHLHSQLPASPSAASMGALAGFDASPSSSAGGSAAGRRARAPAAVDGTHAQVIMGLRMELDVLKEKVHLQAASDDEVRALHHIVLRSTEDLGRAIEDVSSAVTASEQKLQEDVDQTRRICASIVDVLQEMRADEGSDGFKAPTPALFNTCLASMMGSALPKQQEEAEASCAATAGGVVVPENALDATLATMSEAAGAESLIAKDGACRGIMTPDTSSYLTRALLAVQELRQQNNKLRKENAEIVDQILQQDDGTMSPLDIEGIQWKATSASGCETPMGEFSTQQLPAAVGSATMLERVVEGTGGAAALSGGDSGPGSAAGLGVGAEAAPGSLARAALGGAEPTSLDVPMAVLTAPAAPAPAVVQQHVVARARATSDLQAEAPVSPLLAGAAPQPVAMRAPWPPSCGGVAAPTASATLPVFHRAVSAGAAAGLPATQTTDPIGKPFATAKAAYLSAAQGPESRPSTVASSTTPPRSSEAP